MKSSSWGDAARCHHRFPCLPRAGGETTASSEERATFPSSSQTHLYSVKYLFLHYFTRVVFTKTLQKFPKQRHAGEEKEKGKSTVDLVPRS